MQKIPLIMIVQVHFNLDFNRKYLAGTGIRTRPMSSRLGNGKASYQSITLLLLVASTLWDLWAVTKTFYSVTGYITLTLYIQ